MLLKTVFWGNSEFSIPTLEMLYAMTNLLEIYTGPDKPFGRNLKQIKIPEPKEFAHKHNLPVHQPADLKDESIAQHLQKLKPDLMVVLSYGKLIPKKIYDIPLLGMINLHGSLLPKYRGASPIQQSLLNGDDCTGITVQKINDRIDHGNILYTVQTKIEEYDTYPLLRRKLSVACAKAMEDYILLLKKGEPIREIIQDDAISSHCKKIHKEDGLIHFKRDTARDIFNKWRAFVDWPGIYCNYKGNMLKFREIEIIDDHETGQGGKVLKADREGLIIDTVRGKIRINRLQPANRKEMYYIDFLNGHPIKTGEFLE